MNLLTISGTVIAADFTSASEMKNSTNDLLRLKVNVRTGQKKAEGEEYAPSYILSVPIWGKFATAINGKVVKGSKICVAGTLAKPTIYGDSGINMELSNVMLDTFQSFDDISGGGDEPVVTKETKASKKDKTKNSLLNDDSAEVEDDDDIPF
jgi:single-stranded DNA-binding protein